MDAPDSGTSHYGVSGILLLNELHSLSDQVKHVQIVLTQNTPPAVEATLVSVLHMT